MERRTDGQTDGRTDRNLHAYVALLRRVQQKAHAQLQICKKKRAKFKKKKISIKLYEELCS